MEGVFCVDRLLPDVSLTGNRLTTALGFPGKRRHLAPRLRAAAARRGRPAPVAEGQGRDHSQYHGDERR